MDFLKQTVNIPLPRDVIERVAQRTEGWLAGLQLVTLSLQGRGEAGSLLEEVDGSQRYIFDYLIEEVFGRQSAAVQTFLLQTSILTQLSAPLCDAILERSGSQQLLDQLEHANSNAACNDTHLALPRQPVVCASWTTARCDIPCHHRPGVAMGS